MTIHVRVNLIFSVLIRLVPSIISTKEKRKKLFSFYALIVSSLAFFFSQSQINYQSHPATFISRNHPCFVFIHYMYIYIYLYVNTYKHWCFDRNLYWQKSLYTWRIYWKEQNVWWQSAFIALSKRALLTSPLIEKAFQIFFLSSITQKNCLWTIVNFFSKNLLISNSKNFLSFYDK